MASIDIGPDSDLKLDRGSRATATSLGPHLSRLLGRLNIEGTVVSSCWSLPGKSRPCICRRFYFRRSAGSLQRCATS
jgi:hypothetical protein